MTPRPPFKRRRLGRRLRAMREQARLTMEQAARKLDMSRTSLLRIESGTYRANVHLIRSMMDIYDCYVDGLLDEAREALKSPWYQRSRPGRGYVGLEDAAELVEEFCGPNVPGLLQTEQYIRALFAPDLTPRSPKDLEDDVAVRLHRQRRLVDKHDPLGFVAVIDEAALRREVGGAEVMRGQLKHLIEAADLPTVTVQVLLLRDGAHGATDGGFVLLSFPDDYPDLLYVSYATGSLHIEDKNQIHVARLLFDQLRSKALDPAESVTFIEKVSAELGNR